jgi:Cyclic nucleotide-binding domain
VDGALSVLLVATALSLLGIGNAGVGVLEASLGVGALVGSVVVLALVGRKRLAADLGIGLAVLGAPLAAIGALPYAAVAVLAFAVVGLGNTIVDVSAVTLVQRAAPPEVTARVFGVLESVLTGTFGLGALIAPALIAAIGTRSTLVAVGLVLPVLTGLCWRKLGNIDVATSVPEDRLAAVRGVPFLSTLPLPGIESVAASLQPVEAPAGAVLFERGDAGDRFYIVTDGAVEIDLPEGVKLEEAPCYVGEIALLRDIPRTATVRVSVPSVLWSLERDDFLTAVRGHDRSHAAASEIASARLLAS